MKLFINKGICERKWNDNVKIEEDSKLKLSIPNYLETERRQEYIRFILPDIKERALEKDFLLDNVTLEKTSKNTYHAIYSEKHGEPYMYALLRSTEVVPDDVYIPASMRDRVKVLRRMRFFDDEVDYGDFLSNVYLIKIKLDLDESLPVYLTYSDSCLLKEHFVFYRLACDKKYHVTDILNTHIQLNKNNIEEYISLAHLCE